MKSKLFFILPFIIVCGILVYCGFLFFDTNRTIFYLIEGGTVLSIILFVLVYKRLVRPYQILVDSIDMLQGQDFSSRLRPVKNDEANNLIDIFNQMMAQLKNERLSVREKNHFLDLLINASPQGVIILDFDYRVTSINPAGERILDIKSLEEIKGKRFVETSIRLCHQLANLTPQKETIIKTSGANLYRCTLSSFIDRGFPHPFILIEELTHELFTIEKKSYENVIRMMSHEVNNSIGAINSTLEVVADISDENDQFEDISLAVKASYERGKHLAEFVSNLADVVKIPKPYISKVNLNELVKTVSNFVYSECSKRNIALDLNLPSRDILVKIDGIQFEYILLNIIKNAYEAIDHDGTIRITIEENPAKLIIANDGPSLSEELVQNLFTPFYTTKSEGQGVGLMFVREVLLNHGCKFDFYSEGGWTKFVINLFSN
ncbi:PAS domain-containing sensor histidine kinase [Dysgonomonas sp. Marseille-P4361]|uniref:sensor histidine kinase n=1 Tax=Dysgonomonas sp. Marseille-P4361 TaxID=2161820 RepID=UPI000D55C36D|nr:ATP-binding protein [Dysgonomonas sp. Marseille-P4361]